MKKILTRVVIFLILVVSFTTIAKAMDSNDFSNVYANDELGITLIIPEGWSLSEENANKNGKTIFVTEKDEQRLISFVQMDLREYYQDSEKFNLEKEIEDVVVAALAFGKTPSEIETMDYNGNTYFVSNLMLEDKNAVEGKHIVLMHIENMQGYAFAFSGDLKDALYADFEYMINSVEYTKTGTLTIGSEEINLNKDAKIKGIFNNISSFKVVLFTICGLIVVVAIVVGTIIIFKNKKISKTSYVESATDNINVAPSMKKDSTATGDSGKYVTTMLAEASDES